MKKNVGPIAIAVSVIVVLVIAVIFYMHSTGTSTNGKVSAPPAYMSASEGKPGGIIPPQKYDPNASPVNKNVPAQSTQSSNGLVNPNSYGSQR